MKHLYNVLATIPTGKANKLVVPEVHVGLFDNTNILETGLTAFLFNQIKEDEWHVNNSVIVPNITEMLFRESSQIEVPVAAAIWQEDINFWTYRNFIARINQIPLLVSSQDVMNYITGQPLTVSK